MCRNLQDNDKIKSSFIQQLFQFKSFINVNCSVRNPYNLQQYKPNQVTFCSKNLKSLGSKVWNSLSDKTKSAETQ